MQTPAAAPAPLPVLLVPSPGVRRIGTLAAMLDQYRLVHQAENAAPAGVLGWGCKPSAVRAAALARRLGAPLLTLEDGFVRSYGTGDRFPPLSIVLDREGIYYDSTRPSALETMLQSDADLLAPVAAEAARARAFILQHGLSKYNHAPPLADGVLRPGDARRILVVDQTAGDLSVSLGGASAATFSAMLAAARAEHPGATIYVKTHPEVSSGKKGGYLTAVQDDAATVVLRAAVSPLSLVESMDQVYVVTSTLGFEALLAGKKVSVFGLPWYAGWGATDDRQRCPRRSRARSVDELFAAAYFHYARYLDPATGRRGSIFDVLDWLVRQRAMAAAQPGRLICVGYRRWKAANIEPMLSLDRACVRFVRDAAAAAALAPGAADSLVHWGARAPAGLAALAQASGARLLRMEDGFVRSVGLGSDLIRPWSLVLDGDGIYFDPSTPSALETMLAGAVFDAAELAAAQRVRQFIVRHDITKYNLEPRAPLAWPSGARQVVLVPGQVEDDASILLGCTEVRTNLALLQRARAAHPDGWIVYKPHPDVLSGNRKGALALSAAAQYADAIATGQSVVSCINACDVVHTMTSLTGFDALLRGKRVVVYGQPFYAGWGLTEDMAGQGAALTRRRRCLQLDELVAGALLRYPLYWDWELQGYTSCEAVLHALLRRRTALESTGGLEQLRVGRWRRQWRKLSLLARVWSGRR
ncbi:MAG: capsular polysaccharide biosynthesis protein [Massilia sp.]|nr:capsular polysaccharide biosynthesis protein [Massilia sp.]